MSHFGYLIFTVVLVNAFSQAIISSPILNIVSSVNELFCATTVSLYSGANVSNIKLVFLYSSDNLL